MRELELYIHIPFCVKKCAYCDFLSAPGGKEQRDRYVQMLLEEIHGGIPVSAFNDVLMPGTNGSIKWEDYTVTSVFFGGGTPSILPASQIVEIMTALRARFCLSETCEITVECNPGTLSEKGESSEKEKLVAFHACGVNRISFGLQSADPTELVTLGRIHTWETFLHSYEAARAAGFANINVDLMSALPGQTAESWKNTLQQILMLAPEHISAYSLIIEEGTPFYQMYHEDDARRAAGEQPVFLPSEEEERRMYALTGQLLGEAGYEHYEISNYALPGYECRHNIGYWRGTEYMGFGLGASSLIRYRRESDVKTPPCESSAAACVGYAENASALAGAGKSGYLPLVSARCQNPADYPEYEKLVGSFCAGKTDTENERIGETDIKSADREAERVLNDREQSYEILSVEDEMSEFMFLGLRMLSGISEQDFLDRFHLPVDTVYGEVIERMTSLDLLKREEGRIFLTSRGLDLSNQVMAEFLL